MGLYSQNSPHLAIAVMMLFDIENSVQSNHPEKVRGGSMCLNHPELVHKHPAHSNLYRTFSNYIVTGETRCAGCLCTSSGCSSNFPKPHHYRACRVLSHEFGVVRLYQTFSIYIVIGETRCAGFLCTSSSTSNLF